MPKRVLVTGGCGFLGSHVCEYFLRQGWAVVSYDNMTKHELMRTGLAAEEARNHNLQFLDELGVKLVRADVCNFEALDAHCEGVDYIVHTAAQPAMTISWEDPVLDFHSNTLGTFNALEVARRRKIPTAACASVHVYGNDINHELTEGPLRYQRDPVEIGEEYRPLQGVLTPLHASKGAGDIYLKAYVDTYKLEAASFRLTGIYGTRQFGGEDHGWVANFAIRAFLGWPLTIFGSGKQVRDIIYATDVCEAFDAFYKTRAPGIYNIGGGEKTSISLLQCIDIIGEILGKRPEVKFAPDRHGDLRYFVCNVAKAKREMRWVPHTLPREGISKLLEWVGANKQFLVRDEGK